jgi:hypothetical protein
VLQVEAELKHLYVAKMEELVYARDLQVQQERLQGELGHEDAPTVAQVQRPDKSAVAMLAGAPIRELAVRQA